MRRGRRAARCSGAEARCATPSHPPGRCPPSAPASQVGQRAAGASMPAAPARPGRRRLPCTSTCSAIARASSTSVQRQRTVLSGFVSPAAAALRADCRSSCKSAPASSGVTIEHRKAALAPLSLKANTAGPDILRLQRVIPADQAPLVPGVVPARRNGVSDARGLFSDTDPLPPRHRVAFDRLGQPARKGRHRTDSGRSRNRCGRGRPPGLKSGPGG